MNAPADISAIQEATVSLKVHEAILRGRYFEAYRLPASETVCQLTEGVFIRLDQHERSLSPRKRARKAGTKVDLLTLYRNTVGAVICDLVHRHLTAPGEWIKVPFSNRLLGQRSRYRAPIFVNSFRTVIEQMAHPEVGILELVRGEQRKAPVSQELKTRQTAIRPGRWLIERIEAHQIELGELRCDSAEETIILRGKRPESDGEASGSNVPEFGWFTARRGELIEYEDDENTQRFREEMRSINGYLAIADLAFDETCREGSEQPVDITDRRLRRCFNEEDFNKGGRLYGGFWQPLSKRQRRGLAIDGQHVIELDFEQMAPRILYGFARVEPPEGDLYLIPGYEEHRAGVKKLFNAVTFARNGELTRLPKGTAGLFPRGTSVAEVISAIKATHRPIAHILTTPRVGFHVMNSESRILIEVLLKLIGQTITALPIHDAILVAQDHVEHARSVMLETFLRMRGVSGRVSINTLS